MSEENSNKQPICYITGSPKVNEKGELYGSFTIHSCPTVCEPQSKAAGVIGDAWTLEIIKYIFSFIPLDK